MDGREWLVDGRRRLAAVAQDLDDHSRRPADQHSAFCRCFYSAFGRHVAFMSRHGLASHSQARLELLQDPKVLGFTVARQKVCQMVINRDRARKKDVLMFPGRSGRNFEGSKQRLDRVLIQT